MTWDPPTAYVVGLFVVITIGVVLPVRLEDREDHVILTIAGAVGLGVMGIAVLPLVWCGVVVGVPFICAWALLPRNVERLGWPGATRSVAWAVVTGVAITVGDVCGVGVYRAVFDGSFPVDLSTTSTLLEAGVMGLVTWIGTMAVRLLSMRRMSGSLTGGLDPIDSPLAPFLLPLMGGFPLIVASIAMYDADDPWTSLLILWWCFPIYAATAFDLHRRRLAQDLRRDALAAQRLAAIGEVSARIVHQSRHQVGLMGWSIHRLRGLVGRSDPASAAAAEQELTALTEAKDRLSEMLTAELLHERARSESGPTVGADAGPSTASTTTLRSLVDGVVTQLAGEAAREAIELEASVAVALGGLPAPVQLPDVVFNLVDNAIDAAASRVTLRVEQRNGDGVVVVDDDGPGLDGLEVRRALEPFFTTKADGTGMGLAIADALVADLGGELRYSRADDTTTFEVRFPLPGADAPQVTPVA